jgi:hypothetical protein
MDFLLSGKMLTLFGILMPGKAGALRVMPQRMNGERCPRPGACKRESGGTDEKRIGVPVERSHPEIKANWIKLDEDRNHTPTRLAGSADFSAIRLRIRTSRNGFPLGIHLHDQPCSPGNKRRIRLAGCVHHERAHRTRREFR